MHTSWCNTQACEGNNNWPSLKAIRRWIRGPGRLIGGRRASVHHWLMFGQYVMCMICWCKKFGGRTVCLRADVTVGCAGIGGGTSSWHQNALLNSRSRSDDWMFKSRRTWRRIKNDEWIRESSHVPLRIKSERMEGGRGRGRGRRRLTWSFWGVEWIAKPATSHCV